MKKHISMKSRACERNRIHERRAYRARNLYRIIEILGYKELGAAEISVI